jgi:hypothetical protein
MHPGNSNRLFFFIQATNYLKAYAETLPDHSPTSEEIDSGLSGLSEDFGIYASVIRIAREMSIEPDTLYGWPTVNFYHLQRFLAWEGHFTNQYHELMRNKK